MRIDKSDYAFNCPECNAELDVVIPVCLCNLCFAISGVCQCNDCSVETCSKNCYRKDQSDR